jgi:hypothetical protein
MVFGVPVDAPPMRMPEGANITSMGARSIFEGPVKNPEIRTLTLRPDRFAVRAGTEPEPRPRAFAQPVMGEDDPGVMKILQREIPPEGLSSAEAAILASDLVPALDAAAKAIEEKISCSGVDSTVHREVSVLRERLERFGSSKNESKAELSPPEIRKIQAVLACRETYDQVASARQGRTIAFVVGGVLLGVIVIAVIS